MAPSCGTCSRAREKRLFSLEKAGVKTPIPLRSVSQPDQLDGLSGLDKIKVEKANMLYDAVYVLASLACSLTQGSGHSQADCTAYAIAGSGQKKMLL
jgi:hypothetical protein